jgi:hypothetical protein
MKGTAHTFLVDDDAGRTARLHRGGGLLEVVPAEHPRRRAPQDLDVQLAVPVEVTDLQDDEGTVRVLADEDEVQDADDAAVDQVDEQRERLPAKPCPGELDHQVVDRAQVVDVLGHVVASVSVPLVSSAASRPRGSRASPATDEPIEPATATRSVISAG